MLPARLLQNGGWKLSWGLISSHRKKARLHDVRLSLERIQRDLEEQYYQTTFEFGW